MEYTYDHEKTKEYYLSCWKAILGNLLGWSQGEVVRHCCEEGDSFLESLLLAHETPAYYVVPQFMPQGAFEELKLGRYHELISRIDRAIMDGSVDREFDERCDWRGIANRINAIRQEFGFATIVWNRMDRS